jgi:hypothetical protein
MKSLSVETQAESHSEARSRTRIDQNLFTGSELVFTHPKLRWQGSDLFMTNRSFAGGMGIQVRLLPQSAGGI